MTRFWSLFTLCGLACVLWAGMVASGPPTIDVRIELSEDGDNYDDPCFWQDPQDHGSFLAFMTSKDDALVDVWRMPSRRHVAQVTGFKRTANNCDVDQSKNLLVTTDPKAKEIRVHDIPGFRLRAVIRDSHLRKPSGIAVGHAGGHSYAFVTDEKSHEVHVFHLPDGAAVRRFPYKLDKAEGISADDDRGIIYVSDDKSDRRGTKAFSFEGVEIREFGIEETGSDSEGNALYRCGPQAGYVIVSDQRQSNRASAYSEFEVFDRETFAHVGTFRLRGPDGDWTGSTDGIDIFQGAATAATGGVFAACDGCGQHGQAIDELDIVGWDAIAKELGLAVCPNGGPPKPGLEKRASRDGLISLSGTLRSPYRNKSLAAAVTIDARKATFIASAKNRYPINLGGGADVCVAGGTIRGEFDRRLGWRRMHDLNNAAVSFENERLIVDAVRIDNVTDGIRPRPGGSFTIRNAWLSYIRDDCVENDHLQGGVVDGSLLDGCYVAFSARPSKANVAKGIDGSRRVWTIKNSLIRLEPMPGPRGGSRDGLGHGGFFKWHKRDDPAHSLSPELVLYNNIFMAERVGQLPPNRMAPPPGRIADCSNNVMVWLGPGAFPARLPSCFRVTKDRAVWDRAVAAWVGAYGENARRRACESAAERPTAAIHR